MLAALARMHIPQALPRPEITLPELDARAQQEKLARDLARSAERSFVARFVVLNLIGLALVAAAWAAEVLAKPYQADSSGMCWLITVLFAWGLVCCARRDWQSVRWVGNVLVYRDQNHVTTNFATWTSPALAAELDVVLAAAPTNGGG